MNCKRLMGVTLGMIPKKTSENIKSGIALAKSSPLGAEGQNK